jgi:hypothetical protein
VARALETWTAEQAELLARIATALAARHLADAVCALLDEASVLARTRHRVVMAGGLTR